MNDIPEILERLNGEMDKSDKIQYPFHGIRGDEDSETILSKLGKEELFGALECVKMYQSHLDLFVSNIQTAQLDANLRKINEKLEFINK